MCMYSSLNCFHVYMKCRSEHIYTVLHMPAELFGYTVNCKVVPVLN
jgi:hypothetical protein